MFGYVHFYVFLEETESKIYVGKHYVCCEHYL